ncbi:DNA cytosine methyltransferase [Clostridium perfringens]
MLRVFECFSGYGSQSIALRNIGVDFEVVAISEIDKYAIAAYESIHGPVNNLGDVTKLKISDIPEHDLFTYSFPCTDISLAGRMEGLKKGSGTRSGLLWECEKIIIEKKPKFLLMENVKNLLGKKFIEDFKEWCNLLESHGYKNYFKVLDARDFDVPQNRERIFMVSILGEHKEFKFPEKIQLKKRIVDILDQKVDSKYAISEDMEKKFVSNKNFTNDNLNEIESSEIRQIGFLKKSENGKKHQSNTIYDGRCVARTLMACDYKSPLLIMLDGKIRKLSPKEYFRLMGLNEDDIEKIQKAKISPTQQYKMAGNSIVVPVLEGIFKEMLGRKQDEL